MVGAIRDGAEAGTAQGEAVVGDNIVVGATDGGDVAASLLQLVEVDGPDAANAEDEDGGGGRHDHIMGCFWDKRWESEVAGGFARPRGSVGIAAGVFYRLFCSNISHVLRWLYGFL